MSIQRHKGHVEKEKENDIIPVFDIVLGTGQLCCSLIFQGYLF